MTALAPVLQRFFTDRLIRQRQASPHTIASYRDTFSLLLRFTQSQLQEALARLYEGEVLTKEAWHNRERGFTVNPHSRNLSSASAWVLAKGALTSPQW